jgi:Leucine-rich repeat (LRR) protein
MALSSSSPADLSLCILILCFFLPGCGGDASEDLSNRAGRPSPEQVNQILRERYAAGENFDTQIKTIGGRIQISLDLSYTQLNDNDFAKLELPEYLSELNLAGTAITAAGLAHLEDAQNLEKIDLSHTTVTDDCLKTLQSLPRLQAANLNYTKVSPEQQLEMVRFFRSRRPSYNPKEP